MGVTSGVQKERWSHSDVVGKEDAGASGRQLLAGTFTAEVRLNRREFSRSWDDPIPKPHARGNIPPQAAYAKPRNSAN